MGKVKIISGVNTKNLGEGVAQAYHQKPLNKTIPKPETQEDIDKEVSEALL